MSSVGWSFPDFFLCFVLMLSIGTFFWDTFTLEASLHQSERGLVREAGRGISSDKSWALDHFRQVSLMLSLSNQSFALPPEEDLPTNQLIAELYGDAPLLVGQNQCTDFRQRVPNPQERWIGVAGLFNTGTNLLSQLLKHNCQMPGTISTGGSSDSSSDDDRRNNKAVLWQVPWGKHSVATVSRNRTAPTGRGIDKDHGLVVVAVRNPFHWARSMCKNPYIVKWKHNKSNCPNLAEPVETWENEGNLIHFYNHWYQSYAEQFPFPRIIVRLEDLTLRPKETVQEICKCAGGTMREGAFSYSVQSAKGGDGHRSTTGMVKAWKAVTSNKPNGGFPVNDYRIALTSLDMDLMRLFGYKLPPAASFVSA